MAQTGYSPILIYSSSTASNTPSAGNLTNSTLGSELAINITDGKLFYKDNGGSVQVIGWKTVPATAGGTGQTSYAVGDLLYADTTTTLTKLADVATGNALISGGVSTAPSWGKIGLATHVSGVLPVANGGTNASSASITAFNNITGYSASGATGTTSTNLVFSTSPSINTPTLVGDATLSTGNLVIGTSGKGITTSVTNGNINLTPDGTGVVVSPALAKFIGYVGHNGTSGANYGSVFNIYWTGNAQLWIDSTFVGDIQLSSDYRIKRNVETQVQSGLDRITQLRPVTYQRADFGNLFKAEDEVREGFIAHELQAVIPSAVQGEKDAENQIQSLRLDALCSVLVKAVQELKVEIDSLKKQLAAKG
jgi:Chaperone of endosialidase